MDQNTSAFSSKRILIIVGIVALILLGIFVLRHKKSQSNVGDLTRTEIPAAQAPKRFPGDVPIPGNAVLDRNTETVAPDGREQSTKAYHDARSFEEVVAAYEQYLADAEWKVLNKATLEGYAAYAAERDGTSLQVTINRSRGAQGASVTLIVTDAAPSVSN